MEVTGRRVSYVHEIPVYTSYAGWYMISLLLVFCNLMCLERGLRSEKCPRRTFASDTRRSSNGYRIICSPLEIMVCGKCAGGP